MKFESGPRKRHIEKPRVLYHGTVRSDLSALEPRRRYTPQGLDVGARVYASISPAIAAAHAFPWGSKEGFGLSLINDVVTLSVPRAHITRLDQEVSVYSIPSDTFSFTSEDVMGTSFHSEATVEPQNVKTFKNVWKAIEYFGGKVEIVD